jgi:hypothetical protein
MTPEQLIAEGRKLERPSVFLQPAGTGPIAAVWYARDQGEIDSTGFRCWLTVDARHIPGPPPPGAGYINVFTNEITCEGGRVEVVPSWPRRAGTPLYAHTASVLPPIEAVFARGSETVGDWIASYGWNRSERYNANFKGNAIVERYDRILADEFPMCFESDIYAVLGGWHFPCADDDWYNLMDEQLLVLTIRDSEPWVEAWRTRTGEFKVIQRIT